MKKNLFTIIFLLTTTIIYAQDWAWLRGNKTGSVVSSYGTLGVSSPANDPGGRHGAASWTDNSGNLWQFGGEGYASTPVMGWLNDLWKYDPSTNEWTWMRGPNVIDSPGQYGSIGVSSPANDPGAREFHSWWKDNSGNFWVFGGDGFDALGNFGRLNDLWKYNVTTNEWTWIKGSNLINANGTYGTKGVSAPANTPGARHGAGTWVDANNNLWLIGGYGYPASGSDGHLNDVWKYDPITNEWTWINGNNTFNSFGIYGPKSLPVPSNSPGAREFMAIWKDPASPAVWMFGGGGYSSAAGPGHLNDLWRYNPGGNVWTYVSGTDLLNQAGAYGTQGVPSNTNIPGGRYSMAPIMDNWGNLWMFGGIGYSGLSIIGRLNDLFRYTPSTDEWTWMKGDNNVNQFGNYGPMGVFAPTNNPGSRYYNYGWKDLNGDFWIFGCFGLSSSGPFQNMNDLWKFEMSCQPFNITDPFNTNICNGDSTSLSVSTISSSTVSWYNSPTSTIVLGTGNNFNTGPLSIGTYTFYAEGTPCSERVGIEVIVSSCTSIKEQGANSKVTLYPNPSTGKITVETSVSESELMIFNTLGQQVFIKKLSEGKNFLETDLRSGIYHYSINEKDKNLRSGKLIIE
jgi:N-acetylneuraminic acid mutarotase